MTFLPVVDRELRVASRRRTTYWTRFLAALITIGLSAWIWVEITAGRPAHERGHLVFQVVSGLALAYSLLAGVFVTADSLSEEKREGTLGFLFLTDLKGYDVVLGKLAATSLNAFYSLISVFPLLAVPLLLGALTFDEFWRMILVLVNTLFFSLGVGMFASAISRLERRAMTGTLVLILLLTAAPFLIGLIAAYQSKPPTFNPYWLLSSTVYPCVLAFDAAYKTNRHLFWSALATTHLLGWTCLICASAIVRRVWQDRPAIGQKARWRDRWQTWQFGSSTARAGFRRRLLGVNPLFWLASRDRLKPIYVLLALSLFGGAWLWLYHKYRTSMFDPSMYVLTAYCLHTMIKLWLASESCRPLAEDRKSGALELVLSTPISIDEILEGQLLAFKRQFGWPVALVLAVDMVMLLAGLRDPSADAASDWLFLCAGLMLLFIADLYTLSWVGMWLGLSTQKLNQAVRGSIGRVLVLPWAVLLIGLAFLAAFPMPGLETGEFGLLTVAFTLGLLNDAFWFNRSRTSLKQRFRVVATQRFQSRTESDAGLTDATPSVAAIPPVVARPG